ncbi:hypothetical protein [Halegenticoccus soli]|uniref:hypothetical protein n=1 Tax=Halegenticoccus soli TaxID=1985678 RepID=UPI00130466CF|nr:hypothetical protein [Halegenticoccus soli]
MANPRTVKRALRRLALGAEPPTPADHRRTIRAGADALASVEDAAAFFERSGESDLRAAVATAERRADDDAARAGRRVLARVERYRRAAADAVLNPPADADDHFRPGRTTPLPSGCQGGSR